MYFVIVSLCTVAVIYGYCGWRLLVPLQLHSALAVAAWLSLTALALLLIMGPELLFIGDSFNTRMNTVFKLYYMPLIHI